MKPRLAHSETEAPMVLRGAKKALAQDAKQFRHYRRFLMLERRELLNGHAGPMVRDLLAVMRVLTPMSAPSLCNVLERFSWFEASDHDTRVKILSLINDQIMRMRIRNGLSPIDDSLPGEEPTVFEICRAKLTGAPQ